MKTITPIRECWMDSEVKRGRLIQKIPMSRDYIDENDNLFRLIECSDGIVWVYIGSILRT